MKLENQVCTLEQAKRIKELGVAYESIFRYVSDYKGEFECVLSWGYEWSDYPCHAGSNDIISAYTVAELGVMLPNLIAIEYKLDEFFDNHFSDLPAKEKELRFWGAIMSATFLAAMLIYLLENNLTTSEEVNKRLQAA